MVWIALTEQLYTKEAWSVKIKVKQNEKKKQLTLLRHADMRREAEI